MMIQPRRRPAQLPFDVEELAAQVLREREGQAAPLEDEAVRAARARGLVK
jgi:hypothetical protein